ncbi:MAG: hypothetical protein JXM70_27675 [Pirellulales bacterium]|nr:hypothetical protein [Pirellulales bacterium]
MPFLTHRSQSTARYTLALGTLVLLLAGGCGKPAQPRGAIRGKVTLDGQLLEEGAILFVPISGTKGVVAGGPIQKGEYRLAGEEGPAVGINRVEIRAMPRKTGKMIPDPYKKDGSMIEQRVAGVPPRFNSSSTLKTEVKLGDNVADFEVFSK